MFMIVMVLVMTCSRLRESAASHQSTTQRLNSRIAMTPPRTHHTTPPLVLMVVIDLYVQDKAL